MILNLQAWINAKGIATGRQQGALVVYIPVQGGGCKEIVITSTEQARALMGERA